LRRQPHLVIEIEISYGENMSRAEFQEHCLVVAAIYRRVWREIEAGMESLRPLLVANEVGFFKMEITTTPEALDGIESPDDHEGDVVVITREFRFMRSLDSFLIMIVEYDPETDEYPENRSQIYVIEGEQT
jgi:hypothetical protein